MLNEISDFIENSLAVCLKTLARLQSTKIYDFHPFGDKVSDAGIEVKETSFP